MNQEDILLLNIYVPNNRGSKIHETKTERRKRNPQRELEISTPSSLIQQADRKSARI